MQKVLVAWIAISALVLPACERKPEQPAKESPASSGGAANKEPAAPAPNPPEDEAKGPGHGGAVVALGETINEGMKIKASRDAGEIKAGGDAPIDIWIDGGLGNVAAVRFWIGTEDAKGSIKAKAAVENAHWHTHGEVPDPLPPGSKLWVEIESKDGRKSVVSFDLKQ